MDKSTHDGESKRSRYGTRANQSDGKSVTTTTSKRDIKGKGKLKREEMDNELELASSDVEIVETKSEIVDPTDR